MLHSYIGIHFEFVIQHTCPFLDEKISNLYTLIYNYAQMLCHIIDPLSVYVFHINVVSHPPDDGAS